MHNDISTPSKAKILEPHRTSVEINFTPHKSAVSTPERTESPVKNDLKNDILEDEAPVEEVQGRSNATEEAGLANEDRALQMHESRTLSSPKEETQLLLQSEKSPSAHTPKSERSIGKKLTEFLYRRLNQGRTSTCYYSY